MTTTTTAEIASDIRDAVDAAEPNVLRIALYQATRDPELAQMKVLRTPLRGGSIVKVEVDPQELSTLRRKAIDYLSSIAHLAAEDRAALVVPPTDVDLRRFMAIMADEEVSDAEFAFRKPILAFDDFPRSSNWTAPPSTPTTRKVAIIGAGFSGIAMAVQLKNLGIPFEIFERREEVGGTWSINTYPSARVDTLSFGYQYSFMKKHPWSEYYAKQAEVREYIERVVEEFDLADSMTLGADVQTASFDEERSVWVLGVRVGDELRTVESSFVVAATGVFAVPKLPEIRGIETFAGEICHTAQWDASIDVTGKRVAVIGNGSTGVQLLKSIADKASEVSVYHRSPQWIWGREHYGDPIPDSLQWMIQHFPYYWNWTVYENVTILLAGQAMQEPDDEWRAAGGLVSKGNDAYRTALIDYLTDQLEGRADLIEKLVPSYPPMARRLVADNQWYKTLLRDHVELVTDPIEGIGPDAVVAGGKSRPTDVIIAATGFDVERYLWPTVFTGLGGVDLRDRWEAAPGPSAYLGMMVPDFPNLFIMYGPNAQARTGESVQAWIESWSKYIADCMIAVIERGAGGIVPRHDAMTRYVAEVDEASNRLIWADAESKGRNYYVNSFGRQQVQAPWRAVDYHARLAHPEFDDFDFIGHVDAV